jgi:anti-anti-sigma factor
MTVRLISATISCIAIDGELTAFADDALMEAYFRASRSTTRVILLDCNGLRYLSSGGIGLLVMLLIRIHREQQRLLAFGMSQHDERIFALTHLNGAISIYETEDEALAAFGGPDHSSKC